MSAIHVLYQRGDSWLHRLDARVKLLLVLCGCGTLLLFDNLWIMVGALLAAHLALWNARIARTKVLWVWRMILPTVIMVLILWVLFNPGDGRAICRIWFVQVTARNLVEGMTAALRISALAFTIFGWLFTTEQADLVRSLLWLGLPYEWGLTISMALRYIPTMSALFGTISDAQQARALDLTRGNPLKKARAHIPIVVAMLITALRMAENLSRALESSALGASGKDRTSLHRLHFCTTDLIVSIGTLVCMALLLWARCALSLGTDPLWLIP